MQLNVRSLYPKIEAIKKLVLDSKPDLLCLCETWLKPDTPTEFINIINYTVVRNDRLNKRGGGTCIYIHDQIHVDTKSNVCISCKDLEMQTICLSGESNHQKPIIIVLVYRPPSRTHTTAVNMICDIVSDFEGIDKKELIILGDLNWDYLNKTQDDKGSRYIDTICDDLQMQQLIKHPTRMSFHRDSLLDVILTNMKNVNQVGTINYNLSDHLPIFIIKKRERVINEYEYIYKRSFKNYDVDKYSEILTELDWSIIDLLDDPNIAWSMVYKGILRVVDDQCPFKHLKVRTNKPVWFNSELCYMERERDILVRNYKRKRIKDETSYQRISLKRKEFNRKLQLTKQNFFKEQIELFKGDSKSFWKLLDNLLGHKSNRVIDRVYYHGTTELCLEHQTANIINTFLLI